MEVHTEQRDGATIVRPQGDIDLSSSSILRTSLQESSQSAEGKLIIDLANVQYMDSSGVATLVECLQLCRRAGTTLLLDPDIMRSSANDVDPHKRFLDRQWSADLEAQQSEAPIHVAGQNQAPIHA